MLLLTLTITLKSMKEDQNLKCTTRISIFERVLIALAAIATIAMLLIPFVLDDEENHHIQSNSVNHTLKQKQHGDDYVN